MSEEIFRKKSIDKIKSPEELNDYVRIANPGIWIVLSAIIVLLAGLCVWGIFGTIESSVPAQISVNNGSIVCTVDANAISTVKIGMPVEANGTEGTVRGVSSDDGTLALDISLPDGVYEAKIITERFAPLSFVFN